MKTRSANFIFFISHPWQACYFTWPAKSLVKCFNIYIYIYILKSLSLSLLILTSIFLHFYFCCFRTKKNHKWCVFRESQTHIPFWFKETWLSETIATGATSIFTRLNRTTSSSSTSPSDLPAPYCFCFNTLLEFIEYFVSIYFLNEAMVNIIIMVEIMTREVCDKNQPKLKDKTKYGK